MHAGVGFGGAGEGVEVCRVTAGRGRGVLAACLPWWAVEHVCTADVGVGHLASALSHMPLPSLQRISLWAATVLEPEHPGKGQRTEHSLGRGSQASTAQSSQELAAQENDYK